MFNFELVNQACKDKRLSNGAFRMLYIITNNCSYNRSETVEIYNAQFMSLLDISERQVERLTKELIELGYIAKTINGTSLNKKANIYSLLYEDKRQKCQSIIETMDIHDRNDEINYVKNDELKNNNKININNNIYNNIGPIDKGPINIEIKKENKINNNIGPVVEETKTTETTEKNNSTFVEYRNFNNSNVCGSSEQREDDKANIEITKEKDIASTFVEDTQTAETTEKNNIASNEAIKKETEETSGVKNLNAVVDDKTQTQEKENITSTFVEDKTNKKYRYHYECLYIEIGEWKRTHRERERISIYNRFEIIHNMHLNHEIDEQQYLQALNHFKNFLIIEEDYDTNKNPTINNNYSAPRRPHPAPADKNANKAQITHTNAQDSKTITETNPSRPCASKCSNLAFINKVCDEKSTMIDTNVLDNLIKRINKADITKQAKVEYLNKYFATKTHMIPQYLDYLKAEALKKIV